MWFDPPPLSFLLAGKPGKEVNEEVRFLNDCFEALLAMYGGHSSAAYALMVDGFHERMLKGHYYSSKSTLMKSLRGIPEKYNIKNYVSEHPVRREEYGLATFAPISDQETERAVASIMPDANNNLLKGAGDAMVHPVPEALRAKVRLRISLESIVILSLTFSSISETTVP